MNIFSGISLVSNETLKERVARNRRFLAENIEALREEFDNLDNMSVKDLIQALKGDEKSEKSV